VEETPQTVRQLEKPIACSHQQFGNGTLIEISQDFVDSGKQIGKVVWEDKNQKPSWVPLSSLLLKE